MRTKAKVLMLCVLSVASILGLIFLRRAPEPVYGGRPLSDWADQYAKAYRARALAFVRPTVLAYTGVDSEAEGAIRAIGTNSFPFLTRWLHFEQNHSLAKLYYSLGLNRLPTPVRNGLHQIAFGEAGQKRAQEALYVLQVLGPEARPMAPLLLRLGQDPHEPDTAYRAFAALNLLGTNGLPQLMQVLAEPNHPYRGVAVRQVQDILQKSPGSSIPIATLVQCVRDRDSSLAIVASELLSRPGTDPGQARAALQANLLSPDPSVRADATNALNRIQP